MKVMVLVVMFETVVLMVVSVFARQTQGYVLTGSPHKTLDAL